MDPLDTWEIVAVVGSTLFLASLCMAGLWALAKSFKEKDDNYKSPSIRDNVKRMK